MQRIPKKAPEGYDHLAFCDFRTALAKHKQSEKKGEQINLLALALRSGHGRWCWVVICLN